MDYQLSLLATLIVVVAALVIGIASSMFMLQGRRRDVWAIFVAVVFVLSAMSAVIFEYSWMFTQTDRILAQAVALGAALTGIVFAARANA